MPEILKRYNGQAGATVKRESGAYQGETDAGTHVFVFSNADVDRYGDTIDVKGWQLKNYESNPIVLFGHDASDVKNVVGRTVRTWVEDGNLMGEIEFVEAGVNPNADIVAKLVKAKFLRTVSVGFRPIEAKASNDPKRRGGWDFKQQELLEVSIVPVPALPSALAKAAALGFERKALEEAGAVTDVPELPKFGVKSFWTISWLAGLMGDANWLLGCMEDEAAGKDQILAGLQAMGQALLDMTEESVAEMLEEHGAGAGEDEVKLLTLDPAAVAFKLFQMGQKEPGVVAALDSVLDHHAKGAKVSFSVAKGEPQTLTRAGRVLSKDNEAALVSVKTALTDAAGLVDKVLSQVAESEEVVDKSAPTTAEDEEEAMRKRREIVAKRMAGSVN